MSRTTTWLALSSIVLAVAAWGAFVYGTMLLGSEREAYAVALEDKGRDEIRAEVRTRLRATVRDTEAGRNMLDSMTQYSIVEAVEAIEAAGGAAGVRNISISQAYPQETTAKNVSAVSVLARAEGSFTSLLRAVSLFETLPLPSVIEQMELQELEEGWALNVRLKVLLATETL